MGVLAVFLAALLVRYGALEPPPATISRSDGHTRVTLSYVACFGNSIVPEAPMPGKKDRCFHNFG